MKNKNMTFMNAEVYNEEYAEAKQRIAGIIKQLESLDKYFHDVKTYDCKGDDFETKVVSEDKGKRLCTFNDKLRNFIGEMNAICYNINNRR